MERYGVARGTLSGQITSIPDGYPPDPGSRGRARQSVPLEATTVIARMHTHIWKSASIWKHPWMTSKYRRHVVTRLHPSAFCGILTIIKTVAESYSLDSDPW